MIGHDEARSALERFLPPVALLVGEEGIGKRTLTRHLAAHYEIASPDCYLVDFLTADHARNIREFVKRAPHESRFRFVGANLDGASTEALNGLLKTLEEETESARFVLYASWEPLSTITSRAQVFRLGLLTESELTLLLTERFDMDIFAARRAAAFANGRVSRALEFPRIEVSKPSVLAFLRAVSEQDHDLLSAVAKKWSPYDKERGTYDLSANVMLQRWCIEALSNSWTIFSSDESYGLERTSLPRRLLVASWATSRQRPDFALRTALLAVVRKEWER